MIKKKDVTVASLLITLGIVYGDIGTSPLYVMQAILSTDYYYSNRELILGGVSLIFWTLTLQTTIKYVVLTLQADNNGEGGILALYALVKKYSKKLIIPAIIGVGAILADGILTPPISVSSAIEGLNLLFTIRDDIIILIVLGILLALFAVQRVGTAKIGKIFGPVMFIWFSMIGILGIIQLIKNPAILEALNPYYAFNLLKNSSDTAYILGAVFLCTTGAEALYSDLGHCGKTNIYYTWIFVKICLLLNYFGQGAYLLADADRKFTNSPFFLIMPDWFLVPGIIIATLATIIASQALISGSFTLISEAIELNVFPRLDIRYPTGEKGQVYINGVNTFLAIGCISVLLYFKKSQNMQSAYGLSITITMLMTTILLSQYIRYVKNKKKLWIPVLLVFGTIESTFLYANSFKILSGGYFTLIITAILIFLMYIWLRSSVLKKKLMNFVNLNDYSNNFKLLKSDEDIAFYASNVVYITKSLKWDEIECKIVYSIFNTNPKKSENYWFLNIITTDDPYTKQYKINMIEENRIFVIDFMLGFKISQSINSLLREVIQKLIEEGEVPFKTKDYTLMPEDRKSIGNFKFIIIEDILTIDNNFAAWDRFILSLYLSIKKFTDSPETWYGIDVSLIDFEKVPIISSESISKLDLKRIY